MKFGPLLEEILATPLVKVKVKRHDMISLDMTLEIRSQVHGMDGSW